MALLDRAPLARAAHRGRDRRAAPKRPSPYLTHFLRSPKCHAGSEPKLAKLARSSARVLSSSVLCCASLNFDDDPGRETAFFAGTQRCTRYAALHAIDPPAARSNLPEPRRQPIGALPIGCRNMDKAAKVNGVC
jgi:hypothetical protein